MRRRFLVSVFFTLVFAACAKIEPKEKIKITQPPLKKGENVRSWEILHDSWASDADRDLVRRVRQALVEDTDTTAFAEAVAIQANNGSIVLRGSGTYALTVDEWQMAGRRAKSVKGVKNIEVISRFATED
ncbi:MAG: hypothetical protein HY644_06830 [Acidobacteria bacterium]|nr:hypothetical protein [Acidobacteriota bacterium]